MRVLSVLTLLYFVNSVSSHSFDVVEMLTSKISPEKWEMAAKCSVQLKDSDLKPVLALRDSMVGPFQSNVLDLRQNLAVDKEGTPFTLTINLIDLEQCKPLKNAVVEIWHADAAGKYSYFSGIDPASGAQTLPCIKSSSESLLSAGNCAVEGSEFLRGAQITDDEGKVTFKTIFPGQFLNRATHIHVSVRTGGEIKEKCEGREFSCYTGGKTHLVSELFFEDKVVERLRQVSAAYPRLSHESQNKNVSDAILLEEDFIFLLTSGAVVEIEPLVVEDSTHDISWMGRAALFVDLSKDIAKEYQENPPGILEVKQSEEELFLSFRRALNKHRAEDVAKWLASSSGFDLIDFVHEDEDKILHSLLSALERRKEAEKKALALPKDQSFSFEKPFRSLQPEATIGWRKTFDKDHETNQSGFSDLFGQIRNSRRSPFSNSDASMGNGYFDEAVSSTPVRSPFVVPLITRENAPSQIEGATVFAPDVVEKAQQEDKKEENKEKENVSSAGEEAKEKESKVKEEKKEIVFLGSDGVDRRRLSRSLLDLAISEVDNVFSWFDHLVGIE